MQMDYYRITDNIHAQGRWRLGQITSDSCQVDEWNFTTGTPHDLTTPLSVMAEKGYSSDFTLADFDVPIISSVVASILLPIAKDDVQIIPVKTEGAGAHDGDWFILNALSLMPCIDEQKSMFTKWSASDGRPDKTGQYRMVPKLIVDENKADAKNLIRIEGWDVPLIVSSVIKAEFENAGVKGAVFKKVS